VPRRFLDRPFPLVFARAGAQRVLQALPHLPDRAHERLAVGVNLAVAAAVLVAAEGRRVQPRADRDARAVEVGADHRVVARIHGPAVGRALAEAVAHDGPAMVEVMADPDLV